VGEREILETYLNSASKTTSKTDIFPYGTKFLLTSVIIPSLFPIASSIIRSLDSGSNKGLKVYITLKNNSTVTYTADPIIRDVITVTRERCTKYEECVSCTY
jgi:hypothetical protein